VKCEVIKVSAKSWKGGIAMGKLFETTQINGMPLSNRFVRSATYAGMANPDGSVSPQLIDMMVKLAEGGVALITTGISSVQKEGRALPLQLEIHSDDMLPGLSQMTNAVHKAGGRIAMQIAHGGAQTTPELIGQAPMGPSALHGENGFTCREMTPKEITDVVQSFGQAAARAKKAGFDAVQLHAAHGYLLSEFLSPFFNRRTDSYGGSVKNRARMVLETYRSVRDAVGGQYPVMIKLNNTDSIDGGVSAEDMLQTAAMLAEAGIDAIEVSGGTTTALFMGNPEASWGKLAPAEAYWREAAMRLKKTVRVPVMLVGGIRSYEVAAKLVDDGVADHISMSRALIREPDLVKRWKSGDTEKAACIADNACMGPSSSLASGDGLQCVFVEK
jgi:2,4-dienoyl-CoA reductase-like NADH-dependent reductase (Old Yellow Enzyme family)